MQNQSNPTESFQLSALSLPPVIFGTSGLGNIYEATPFETKLSIVQACVAHSPGKAVFDTAGKYGAGLALEALGQCLEALRVDPSDVLISNKLGWYQVPLTTPEPTFEPGVWKDLKHDAVQRISYEGILECFHQGNALLGKYTSQLASVHDPDEYLAKATSPEEEEALYQDILEAYRALAELKASGQILGIGVGSKQWQVIERLSNDVPLDWVMIANSLTLHDHPAALVAFIQKLHQKGVVVINSAVFNGGFLIGSDYYNYRLVDEQTEEGKKLVEWRTKFWSVCEQFGIKPAEACFNFGFTIPGVSSVALSTTKPDKVKLNVEMATKKIPEDFWEALMKEGLINARF
ncbi:MULTISPECIES: aldo/keto reductase [unclassified Siphonobacter]|uniref:aldo/keto reductase n=1 Tax=unclassified Siphonobacter TaxID=2635712 RepID=UPI002780B45B|nr:MULTISPECIES: aldo/keto reductase [unclassified Siphonobacter]MDQ1085540.1 D-threo-aldose 1-dehydrogenase [Siphonobacter sp. SORGH_AS_1065]MDR6197378.1 D-threo-aldose 1-dehydrogenase [Siphonobacter sp. SORGH_AS_0500]